MDAEELLEDLNEAQRRAVLSTAQPLTILAGAGSGKTRVLTRRIAHRVAIGSAEARHVLALTFTRKAAGELVKRLRALGLRDTVAAGTFHSAAYAQLRQRWEAQDVAAPALLDRKVGFIAELLPRRRSGPGAPNRETVLFDVVGEIEWAQARRVSPQRYPEVAEKDGRKPVLGVGATADVYARYRQAKRERNLVDFDDLLMKARNELTRDEDWAAAQRWRFRHLFVDEYQDVNPLQQSLLDAWLGDRRDLCVVGDPNQAIYAWNGADAGYLERMADGDGGGEVVRLVDNYRSSPQILAVANRIIAGGPRSRAARRERKGAEEVADLVPHRPEGPAPTIAEHADERVEADRVARAVRDARKPGAPWSSQAILVRTNAQTAVLADALRKVGIPARVRGGAGLLDLPAVKGALRDLRRGSSSFEDAVADLTTLARSAPTDASGEATVEGAAGLEALVDLAHRYRALDATPTVDGFLTWLNDAAADDDPTGSTDAVEVATFHAAKGLEWPVVHLAGLEAGLVPIRMATSPEARAEERRLFYVAVTRAERELHCTWARERSFGQRVASREPSPYLDAVREPDLDDAGDDPVVPPPKRAKRAPKPDIDDADPLTADLKAWRLEVARAGKVPAYVVFNDRTLAEIVDARPTTLDELGAVSGIGPVKVTRYGEDVLEVVRRHVGAAT